MPWIKGFAGNKRSDQLTNKPPDKPSPEQAVDWTRAATIALVTVLTAVTAGIGAAFSNADAESVAGADVGWKCQGCEALGCPDVGSQECFSGHVEVNIGPFGSIGGRVTCYQSEAGSGGPGCSEGPR